MRTHSGSGRSPAGLPRPRFSHRLRRTRHFARARATTRVTPTLAMRPQPAGAAGCRADARRRRTELVGVAARRRARSRPPPMSRPRTAHARRAAARPVHADDRDAARSGRQHQADGTVPLGFGLLHAMRGRGLSPHHLFPRPARRAFGLSRAGRGGQGGGAGAARQRQSRSQGVAGDGPSFRGLARSVQEAELSVRAGRRRSRQSRHDFVTASGRRVELGIYVEPGRESARGLCDGRAEARDGLGRARLRARIRSRRLQHRRRLRLQYGGDGEQGPQRLQRQIRARLAGAPRPTTITPASKRSSPTNISTTGPATASPAGTGSSSA